MRLTIRVILAAAAAGVMIGCASHMSAPATQKTTMAAVHRTPTTAETPLAEIQPAPKLEARPTSAATTQPAPLEALDLYAQARDAMLDNRRYTAIALLEKAIAIDPHSFELEYSLGRAYMEPGSPAENAIAAFEKAAKLDPQNIEVRVQLARLYVNRAQSSKAIDHLRLAMQSDVYKKGNDSAAMVDLLLARALNQKGYFRAALDEYGVLIDRLEHAGPSIRSNAELMYLINRPEILLAQAAQVEESLGDYAAARKGYDAALKRDPGNFELYSHVVRCLTELGKWDDAAGQAADAVRMFHASDESMELLRGVYKQAGRPDAIAEELAKLHKERPGDRAITYVLADVLNSQGKTVEAESLLAGQLVAQQYDSELVRKLFKLYQQSGQVEQAARLLIETMAVNPDTQRETAPLWDEILRFSQKNRLRLATLEKLEVKPPAQAAKEYWVSRVALMWNRDQLSRTALEEAVKLSPPLGPAFRDRVTQIWSDPDTSDAAKSAASDALVRSADAQGQPALGYELRGLIALNQKQPAKAAEDFDQAMKLGRPSIDLQLNYASALVAEGQSAKAEQTLWRLIADNPTYDEAYSLLFQYYLNRGDAAQAIKVLQTWAGADPMSISARVVQSSVYLQAKRPEAAKQIIEPLLDQNPDNAEVLNAAQAFYAQTNQIDAYIQKLEAERTRHPQNRMAAEQLVRLYAAQDRKAAAGRVLDSMKSTAGNDVDYLYYLSHLYTMIGQKGAGEELLQTCLSIDSNYSPAANDLGYSWADEGKNLPRAESLIRLAVAAEPDNQSYLDSLGWVLYKNGKFDDAAKYLKQAVDAAVSPDPIVLNHFGDALYRLGKKTDAIRQWKRSNEQLANQPPDREDTRGLKLQLENKLKQAGKDTPVAVAPIGSEKPPPTDQAKQ